MSDINTWLDRHRLGKYQALFARECIDLDVLLGLSDKDFRDLGIPLGDRRRLLIAIGRGCSVSPGGVEAERRQLTVMFVDLVDSTGFAGRLDPEDLQRILAVFRDTVSTEIQRYQGHVVQFVGDGVVVYFGWPNAVEDAAERAVRAALEVVAAVSRLSAPDGRSLAARVGIDVGTVVVDKFPDAIPVQNAPAIGFTPNLAARLQSLAGPGEVLVSSSVRRLLGEFFELRSLGARDLKGVDDATEVFLVSRERYTSTRFEARRWIQPLVGRDEQLTRLQNCWQDVLAGRGQQVLLEGEAGIGKSRIVQALRDDLCDQPHRQIIWQCLPHHSSEPLYPLSRFLWQSIGLRPGEASDGEVRLCLGKWLQTLPLVSEFDIEELVSVLAYTLGSHSIGGTTTAWTRRSRLMQVIVQGLLEQTQQQPVLLVVEDLHWIDPSTRELLELIAASTHAARLLMLITLRSTGKSAEDVSFCTHRWLLSRLQPQHTGMMLDHLMGEKSLPSIVREEIIVRTDGVPLFIQELTRTVLESGVLRETDTAFLLQGSWQSLSIPAGLQDLLHMRLDRLGELKPVVQIAACLGREFYLEVLAAVLEEPPAVLGRVLSHLQAAGILELREAHPHQLYAFRHTLIRDVAYQSLLKTRRQEIHALIATVLESCFPVWMELAPQLLAEHFTGAGLMNWAVDRWAWAAMRSLDRSANHEALHYARRGIALLDGCQASPERDYHDMQLCFVEGAAGRVVLGFGAPPVTEAFERVRVLAAKLKNTNYLVESAQGLWCEYRIAGRLSEARQLGEQVLSMACDDGQRMTGHYMLGVAVFMQGHIHEAAKHLHAALGLCRDQHPPPGLSAQADPRVYIQAFLGLVACHQGQTQESLAFAHQAVAQARFHAQPLGELDALLLLCLVVYYLQEPMEAQVEALATLATRQREAFFPPWMHFWMSRFSPHLGPAERLAAMDEALLSYRKLARGWLPLCLSEFALLALEMGEVSRAADAVAEGFELLSRSGEHQVLAELHRLDGLIKLHRSPADPGAAELALQQAMEIAHRQGTLLWELRAAMSLASLWQGQGHGNAAADLLRPLLEGFTEIPSTGLLQEARALCNASRTEHPNQRQLSMFAVNWHQ